LERLFYFLALSLREKISIRPTYYALIASPSPKGRRESARREQVAARS
jgi:hypothetical protein